MRKSALLLPVLCVTSLLTSVSGLAATASNACTGSEVWNLGTRIPVRTKASFDRMLSDDTAPGESFSQAVAFEKVAASPDARAFALYWQARSLFQGKLTHLAYEAFGRLASQVPSAATLPMQVAALDCLNRLNEALPAVALPVAPESLSAFPSSRVVSEYALNWIKMGVDGSSASLQSALKLLKGSGPYEALAMGWVAARQGDHPQTIQSLESFLGHSRTGGGVPGALQKHVNSARLLLARALYATGRYELAAARYQQVSKSSNDLTAMLSELSWSYLMSGRYGDAVGAASQLQAGNLSATFAPEAPMVTAMALNELCEFPDSLRSVQKFNRDYFPSYTWLASWAKKKPGSREELYPLAIAFLNGKLKPGTVPERVASEWLRSNVFIALQDEINRIYAEQDAAHAFTSHVKPEATGAWTQVRGAFETTIADRQSELVDEINRDLGARTTQMLTELRDVAENSKMIKVEIYNGASHDMIWQNAHPGYKDAAKKFAQELRDEQKQPATRVWDWGTVRTSSSKIEFWEDEVGAFKANLADNCSNQSKYLALRK